MVQSANASVQRMIDDTRRDMVTDVIDPEYFAGLNRNSTASTPQAWSYRLEACPSLLADSFGARHWISQAFPSLPCGPFPIDCKVERPVSETSVISRSMRGALMDQRRGRSVSRVVSATSSFQGLHRSCGERQGRKWKLRFVKVRWSRVMGLGPSSSIEVASA